MCLFNIYSLLFIDEKKVNLPKKKKMKSNLVKKKPSRTE